MFEGFVESFVEGDGATLFVRHAGSPDLPGLLLLHGYPQTSAMWHKVAPLLTQDFHVICPDLRGYGRSSKPSSDPKHATYSKRAMAGDLVKLMDHFDHDAFYVGAHDRGARVAHRMALDHADRIIATTLLDIAPTREMYRDAGTKFAKAYWHWYFLIQKFPLPETIIGQNPAEFWKLKCFHQAGGDHPFSEDALQEYLTAFATPDAVHASCEDYRAAASIDITHDDQDAGRKVSQPLQVLWAKRGTIEACFDALDLWRERAENVVGHAVDATHYMAEEIPEDIANQMRDFLLKDSSKPEAGK